MAAWSYRGVVVSSWGVLLLLAAQREPTGEPAGPVSNRISRCAAQMRNQWTLRSVPGLAGLDAGDADSEVVVGAADLDVTNQDVGGPDAKQRTRHQVLFNQAG